MVKNTLSSATEDKMQRRYMEYKMLEQQAKQFQEQLEKFETQLIELHNVKEYLNDLHKSPLGSEMLVPLTNGIFVRASLKETEQVVVNVGSNVAVKKSLVETKQLMDQQIEEIEKYKFKLLENLNILLAQAQYIEQELKTYSSEKKKE